MLTVVQVSPNYKGTYKCRAVNAEGELTCSAILEVIGKLMYTVVIDFDIHT